MIHNIFCIHSMSQQIMALLVRIDIMERTNLEQIWKGTQVNTTDRSIEATNGRDHLHNDINSNFRRAEL
jgi:hypothetical protein